MEYRRGQGQQVKYFTDHKVGGYMECRKGNTLCSGMVECSTVSFINTL